MKKQFILQNVVKLFLVILMHLCESAIGCPNLNQTFLASSVDTNNDGRAEFVVIPNDPNLTPFVVEGSSSNVHALRMVNKAIALQYNPPPNQYKNIFLNATNAACGAILFKSTKPGLPSYLIGYSVTGIPILTKIYNDASFGFALSGYSLVSKDWNADQKNELEIIDGDITRGVFIVGADGQMTIDPKMSATAVWRSFLAAATANKPAVVINHLNEEGKAAFGKVIESMGKNLPQLSMHVVDYEAKMLANDVSSMTTIINKNSTNYAFKALVEADQNHLWKIRSF